MSDTQQDPSWWQASDGKWYPPQTQQLPPPPQHVAPPPVPYAAQQPYPGTASGLPSVNGLAVASMVLGIVSLVFSWCWFVGGTCAIVGLPLGATALSRINRGQADPRSKGMAIAGVVMTIISIALVIIIVVSVGTTTNSFNSEFN